MAARSAPLWDPKKSEFLLERYISVKPLYKIVVQIVVAPGKDVPDGIPIVQHVVYGIVPDRLGQHLWVGSQDLVRIKRYNTMLEIGLGCDFYLPFFKLIPELKFCFGLGDVLYKDHVNELRDANMKSFAASVNSATSKMFVLTFYFE